MSTADRAFYFIAVELLSADWADLGADRHLRAAELALLERFIDNGDILRVRTLIFRSLLRGRFAFFQNNLFLLFFRNRGLLFPFHHHILVNNLLIDSFAFGFRTRIFGSWFYEQSFVLRWLWQLFRSGLDTFLQVGRFLCHILSGLIAYIRNILR